MLWLLQSVSADVNSQVCESAAIGDNKQHLEQELHQNIGKYVNSYHSLFYIQRIFYSTKMHIH